MVVKNTSPDISSNFLLMVENTSCLRIFEVLDMGTVAVDYSFHCEGSCSVNKTQVWKSGMFTNWRRISCAQLCYLVVKHGLLH